MAFQTLENPLLWQFLNKQMQTKGRSREEFKAIEESGHGDAGVQLGTLGRLGLGHLNYSSLLSR